MTASLKELLPERPWVLGALSFWPKTRTVDQIAAHLAAGKEMARVGFAATADSLQAAGTGHAIRVLPITRLRALMKHANALPRADETRRCSMVLRVEFWIDDAYRETTYGQFGGADAPVFSVPWQVVATVEALHALPGAITADILLGQFYPDD